MSWLSAFFSDWCPETYDLITGGARAMDEAYAASHPDDDEAVDDGDGA